VEQGYQQMKEELGLDYHEGRSWRGFHHHACLVMLTYEFLSLERRREQQSPAKPGKKGFRACGHRVGAAVVRGDPGDLAPLGGLVGPARGDGGRVARDPPGSEGGAPRRATTRAFRSGYRRARATSPLIPPP
jgi:hypothetical protein